MMYMPLRAGEYEPESSVEDRKLGGAVRQWSELRIRFWSHVILHGSQRTKKPFTWFTNTCIHLPNMEERKKILMAGVSTLTTLVRLRVSVPPDTQDLSLLLWLYHVSMHGSPSSLSMDLSSSSPGAPSYRRTSLRGWVSHYTLLFSVCCCLLHNCLAPILSGTMRAWNVIHVS